MITLLAGIGFVVVVVGFFFALGAVVVFLANERDPNAGQVFVAGLLASLVLAATCGGLYLAGLVAIALVK